MLLASVPPSLRDRPFTSAQARAAGLSHSSLRGPEWRRLFRGVWVHRSVPDTRAMRLAAVRLVLPDRAVACWLTAAWIYGADVRRETDLDVHVSFPKGSRVRSRAGLVVSQETLDPEDIVVIEGLRVTSPVRTAYDALRLSRGLERLVVADALTALRRTSVEEIGTYFQTHRRRRNVRVGERLVDLIEPKSESPMETRLRARLVEGGLPRPVAQYELRDRGGGFVARLDLAYPEQRVAVEYDGAWHWDQRRDDDRRRDAARALGWIVIVVSADDIYAGATQLCGRVGAALRSRLTPTSSATKSA